MPQTRAQALAARCPICMDTSETSALRCGHPICCSCLIHLLAEEELRNECPVCRTSMIIESPVFYISVSMMRHLDRYYNEDYD